MGRLHVITGFLTLVVFFLSGFYMMESLNLLEHAVDAKRMMYRASHIYLLFIGCLNIVVGTYIGSNDFQKGLNLKRFSSVSLIAAQPVLMIAFMVEPKVIDMDRTLTLIGCVLMLVGVLSAAFAKIFVINAKG